MSPHVNVIFPFEERNDGMKKKTVCNDSRIPSETPNIVHNCKETYDGHLERYERKTR
jgi:hypothetical protein